MRCVDHGTDRQNRTPHRNPFSLEYGGIPDPPLLRFDRQANQRASESDFVTRLDTHASWISRRDEHGRTAPDGPGAVTGTKANALYRRSSPRIRVNSMPTTCLAVCSTNVDFPVDASHHYGWWQTRHAAYLIAIVHDHEPLFDQNPGSGLELRHARAVFIHVIRAESR